MIDIAKIGLAADTSDLSAGEIALDKFAKKAGQTEARTDNAMGGVSQSMRQAARATRAGGSAMNDYAKQSTVAMERAAKGARRYGKSADAAAASTTNLMFQFQDIGMMLAMGQNPLMLAMQQGTQVASVFHQMERDGQSAFSGIVSGLKATINPMSLLTIGAIAGGAALVQWGLSAISAGRDGRDLEGIISDTADALKEYEDASKRANMSIKEMAEEFGAATPEIQKALDALESVNLARAVSEIQNLNSAIAEIGQTLLRTDTGDINRLFDLDLVNVSGGRGGRGGLVGPGSDLAGRFRSGQDALSGAVMSGDLQRQSEILSEMLETAQSLADVNGERSAREQEIINQIAQSLLQTETLLGKKQAEEQAAISLTQELRQQAEINALIAQYGEDSAEVVERRAQAERDAFIETNATHLESEALKSALIAAYDAAHAISVTDMASGVSRASAAAAELASQVRSALSSIMQIEARGVASLRESEIRLANRGDAVATAGALARARMLEEQAEIRAQTDNVGELVYLEQQVEAYAAQAEQIARNQQELATYNAAVARSSRLTSGGGGGGGGGGGRRRSASPRIDPGHMRRMREAEQIIRGLETATERYNRELGDLQELQKMGYLTTEQFTKAAKEMEEQFKADKFSEITQGIETFSDAIAGAILGTQDLGDTFRSILTRMASDLLSSGISGFLQGGLLQPSTSSGGGGFLGQVLGGDGFLGKAFAGLFGQGGMIPRGKFGIVGERGPEIVTGPAHVTSRADTQRAMAGQTINQVFNVSTPDARGFQASQRQIMRQAKSALS